MSEYTRNGVRRRYDGKGDAWGNLHRDELGSGDWMVDLDGLFGSLFFSEKSENSLFVEIEPDDRKNKGKVIRRFGIVALFDRKKNHKIMNNAMKGNAFSFATHLYLCRLIATVQPVAPKFFFVIGETSPWYMQEIDIKTGTKGITVKLQNGNWKEVWNRTGLRKIRQELRQWVDRGMPKRGLDKFFPPPSEVA